MSLGKKKRRAASLLKVGVNRVRFDEESLDRIGDAVTRDDVRRLINAGDIVALPSTGTSGGRRKEARAKRAMRGRGPGSKKGKATARSPRKRQWMRQVRVLRGYLKMLKKRGELQDEQFKQFYVRVKGGEVRTLRRLKELVGELKAGR